jgi:AcrR family transcriptional regulator
MSPKRSKEYFAEKKDRILCSAWECFSEFGYSNTTMRDIAKKIDVTTGVIYHYFSGKDEILKAIYDNSLKSSAEIFNNLVSKGNFSDAILEYLSITTGKCTSDEIRKSYKGNINIWAEAMKNDYLKELAHKRYEQITRDIKKIAEFGVENGELKDNLDPELFARGFLALLLGLQVQIVLHDNFDSKDYLYNTINLFLQNNWRE